MSTDRVTYETGVATTANTEAEVIMVPGNGAPGPTFGRDVPFIGGTQPAPDILIRGMMQITPGAGTTAIAIKWRRFQDFAFLNWYVNNFPVTAGVLNYIPFMFYLFGNANFPTLQAAGLGWNADIGMTVQQIGGTAPGTINYICLESEPGYSPRAGH